MDLVAARRILGVAPGARPDEVERAFRAVVARAHPDRGGDAARFREAVAARDLLRGSGRAARAGARPAPVVVVHRRSVVQLVRDGLDRRSRPPRVI